MFRKIAVFLTLLTSLSLASQANSQNATRIELLKRAALEIGDFQEFANARYKNEGTAIYLALDSLGEKFRELLVDPGVSLRVRDFTQFVREQNLSLEDPWSARQKFSDKLGTTTYYRGMNLSEEQIAAISERGILARSLRSHVPVIQSLKPSLAEQIDLRLRNGIFEEDAITSVSKYLGVAWYFSMATAPSLEYSNKQFAVIYEIELPILDVFSQYVPEVQAHRNEFTTVAWDNADDGSELLSFLAIDRNESRVISKLPLTKAIERANEIMAMFARDPDLMRDNRAFWKLLSLHYANAQEEL